MDVLLVLLLAEVGGIQKANDTCQQKNIRFSATKNKSKIQLREFKMYLQSSFDLDFLLCSLLIKDAMMHVAHVGCLTIGA